MAKEYKADQVIERNVVSMEFDNKKFNAKSKDTEKRLKSLKKEMNFEDVDTSGAEKALDKIAVKFDWLRIAAETAIYRITNTAINAGERMVKALSIDNIATGYEKYTQKVTAVQTMMAADSELTLERINAQMAKLQWFTDETSYDLASMQGSMAKFMATGMKLEDAAQSVQGIALWAAEAGQNAQTASNAMYQLSQAMGRGVIKWQDWMSIVTANMSTEAIQGRLIEAGKEMGTITGNAASKSFQELMSAGAFTTEVFTKVMKDYTEFSDYIYENKDAYDTTSEAIRELGDAWAEANQNGTAFAKTALENAQVAKTFQEVIDATKTAVASGWSVTLEHLIGGYEVVKTEMTDISEILWEIFNGTAEARNATLAEWAGLDSGGRADLWQGFKDILTSILQVVQAFRDAWDNVFGEFKAETLAKIVKKFADWAAALKNNEKLFKRITSVFEIFLRVAKLIMGVLKAIWDFVSPILGVIIDIATEVAGVILDLLTAQPIMIEMGKIADKFRMIAENIKNAISGIIGKMKEFGAAIDNFFSETTGKSFKEWCITIIDAFKKVFKAIVSFFALLFSGNGIEGSGVEKESLTDRLLSYTGTFGEAVRDFLSMILLTLKPLIDALGNSLPQMGRILENLIKILTPLISSLLDLTDKVLEFIARNDVGEILKAVLAVVAVLYVLRKIHQINAVVSLLKSITDVIWAFWSRVQAASIKAYTTAFVELALGLLILANINWKGIADNLGAFLIVMGTLAAILFGLAKMLPSLKSISAMGDKSKGQWLSVIGVAAAIAALGLALMGAAVAIKLISTIDPSRVNQAAIVIGAFALLIGIVVKLMSKISIFSGIGLLGLFASMTVIAATITQLSFIFSDLADMIGKFKDISWESLLDTFGKFMAVLGSLVLLAAAATRVMSFKGVALLVVALIGLSHLLKELGLTVDEIRTQIENIVNNFGGTTESTTSEYTDIFKTIGDTLIKMAIAISAILLAIGVFNKLSLKGNAKSLMAVALLVAALGVALFAIFSSLSYLINTLREFQRGTLYKYSRQDTTNLVAVILGLMTAMIAIVMIGAIIMSRAKSSALLRATGFISSIGLVIIAIVGALVGIMVTMAEIQKITSENGQMRNPYNMLWNAVLAILAVVAIIVTALFMILSASTLFRDKDMIVAAETMQTLVIVVTIVVIAIAGALTGIMGAMAGMQAATASSGQMRNPYNMLWNAVLSIIAIMTAMAAFIGTITYIMKSLGKNRNAIIGELIVIFAVISGVIIAIAGSLALIVASLSDMQRTTASSGQMRNPYNMLWNAVMSILAILGAIWFFIESIAYSPLINGSKTIGKNQMLSLYGVAAIISTIALVIIAIASAIAVLIQAISNEALLAAGYSPYAILWNATLSIIAVIGAIALFMAGLELINKKLSKQPILKLLITLSVIVPNIILLIQAFAILAQALGPVYDNPDRWWMLIGTFEILVATMLGICVALIGISKIPRIGDVSNKFLGILLPFAVVCASVSILVASFALLAVALEPVYTHWDNWGMLIATFAIITTAALGIMALMSMMSWHMGVTSAQGKGLQELAIVFTMIAGGMSVLVAALALLAVALTPVYGDWVKFGMLAAALGVVIGGAATIMAAVVGVAFLAQEAPILISDLTAVAIAFTMISGGIAVLVGAFALLVNVIASIMGGANTSEEGIQRINTAAGMLWQIAAIAVILIGAVSSIAAIVGHSTNQSMMQGMIGVSILLGSIAILMLSIVGVLWVMNQVLVATNLDAVKQMGEVIMGILGMLALLVGGIAAILQISKGTTGNTNVAALVSVLAGISTVLAAIALVFFALAQSMNTDNTGNVVAATLLGFLGIIGVIAIMIHAVKAIMGSITTSAGYFNQNRLTSFITIMGAFSGLFAVLAGVFWVIANSAAMLDPDLMFEAVIVIDLFVGSIVALAEVLSMLMENQYGAAGILGGIGILYAIAGVIDLISTAMFKLAVAIDALNVAMRGGDSKLVKEYSKLGEAFADKTYNQTMSTVHDDSRTITVVTDMDQIDKYLGLDEFVEGVEQYTGAYGKAMSQEANKLNNVTTNNSETNVDNSNQNNETQIVINFNGEPNEENIVAAVREANAAFGNPVG